MNRMDALLVCATFCGWAAALSLGWWGWCRHQDALDREADWRESQARIAALEADAACRGKEEQSRPEPVSQVA